AAVGAFLALTSVRDTTVNERVAAGPALAAGAFAGLAHDTTGHAAVVRAADGSLTLTLTRFATSPGPDLFVYLVPGRTDGRGVGGGARVGRLKGNIGNQQYAVPAGFDLSAGATVVVWCRAFSVSFGAATVAAA
ncbi:MAG: DM13 domain-containing protein, partial [Actinobacteria bacterium]|nr:DM13 domain-containing protein [Actinomycetota bacterium]